ncbi:enoyl-CoA hydratase/isomerase family protein [Microbacterium sp. Marseille-Q6965]|uniref:enoyl-CoA hydratase/isomerase family protein n=1 Tax=Microbacterium sp. Marseille-Q6965 TaxID=2965072 RepID=UPI0021B72967|nr:enoyl-CoA hydratase/isomerase family protein [Microbacterium sp. Marseille-Q6965]
MSDAPVLLEVDGGIARITLNRPDRLNAFDAEMARAWERVTTEATGRDDVRAILLRGSGRAFCAGGDVRAMAADLSSGEQVGELARVINRGIAALTASAIPVVAAAHGTTVGGGLGILLSSDWAVVGEDSRIGCGYAGVGLTPDLSVSAHLAAAVGERRALQLALSDRLLAADEAREWGLVADVVAPERVGARAEEVARSWADGAFRAYGEAKRLLRSRAGRSFAQQLEEEARAIGAAFDRDEARERIAAFAARSRG